MSKITLTQKKGRRMDICVEKNKNENMSIKEKQEMLFKMLDLMGILPKGSKDKIEGIIIGLNLRENLEHSNPN